jgi:pyruvate ferredoxin oxidoreductase alpha subunit
MVDYEVMVGNKACAVACKLARVKVAAAFPITPQTSITEYLSELYASGEMPGFEFVNAEGELSAQVIVQAAARTGARAFTCTAGPGLQFMHHPMSDTASGRTPLVMAVVHRGIKSMQPDHSDLMSQSWLGWVHLYVQDAQEILDTILMSYKIGEDPRVRLPVAVGYDGYVLSYTAEPVEIPPQDMIDAWLPPYKPPRSLFYDSPEAPMGRGGGGGGGGDPNTAWKIHHGAVEAAEQVIKEVTAEWAKLTGRSYGNGMIQPYKIDGADVIITAMGTVAGSASAAVDKLWKDGKKVGLVKIRSFVPFPKKDFQELAGKYGAIGVFDRSIQPGVGGPSYNAIRTSTYDTAHTVVAGFVGGLSGKEVTVDNFVKIGEKTLEFAKAKKADAHPIWV